MVHSHGGMSGMGMSGGMDGATGDQFRRINEGISHTFWYLITGAVAIGLVGQMIRAFNNHLRQRQARDGTSSNPTVPHNWASQAWATTIAMYREMSYPQGLWFTKKWLAFLNPPSLGRCLMIFVYWTTITVMLTANTIHGDAYYFERIGFRAAWMSIMQIPLIIVLGGKVNIVGMLIGTSYERLNWLHRWVSRTLLVTVAVHSGFFLREWIRADFLQLELETMTMVKWGMGAGGLLLWMNLSGLTPLRHAFYEVFVIQHLLSIALFLWLVHVHVPSYARYYVWMGVGFIAFDRGTRLIWAFARNIRFRSHGAKLQLSDHIGYRAELRALPGDVTRVIIKNVPFDWHPGQHLYLCIPRIGLIESHPFTISNTSKPTDYSTTTNAQLEVRAHSGFSRRLHKFASNRSDSQNSREVRVFIQGPFGTLPRWNTFDTVVLISASTGASFTLPIMESILDDPCCVRRLDFLLLVRQQPQCSCYLERLRNAAAQRPGRGMTVRIHVAVTQKDLNDEVYEGEIEARCCCGTESPSEGCVCGSNVAAKTSLRPYSTSTSDETEVIQPCCQTDDAPAPATVSERSDVSEKGGYVVQDFRSKNLSTTDVVFLSDRPQLDDVVRHAVEAARGETAVVVCGGRPLSSHVRNCVAALSDERAVHKGSGAQGIFLHVEEFAF